MLILSHKRWLISSNEKAIYLAWPRANVSGKTIWRKKLQFRYHVLAHPDE